MAISKKEVEYIAGLARLYLTEEEKENYSKQLDSILAYMEKLNSLDIDNVVPTSHVIPIENAFREDGVKPSMERTKLLQNGPDLKKGFFAIPKVI